MGTERSKDVKRRSKDAQKDVQKTLLKRSNVLIAKIRQIHNNLAAMISNLKSKCL